MPDTDDTKPKGQIESSEPDVLRNWLNRTREDLADLRAEIEAIKKVLGPEKAAEIFAIKNKGWYMGNRP